MRDVIVVGLVMIAALIGFRRPVFGLLTFAFLGFFSPQSYTWSFGRTIPLSQIVAISTMLGLVVFPERKKLVLGSEGILLILLWITFGWSTIFALFPDVALLRFWDTSKIILMTLVALIVINDEQRLRWLIRVIGFSLGFYALKGGIFGLVTGGAHTVFGPDASFLYANNSIGLALAMNIPVLIYLHKTEELPWMKWIVKAMLLCSYPAILLTYSRGAWLGMVIVTAASLLKSRRKFIALTVGGILVVLLQAIVPKIAPDRLMTRYDNLVNYEQDTSAESRFWNWEFCRRVGVARPLTGGGFTFYKPAVYRKYYPEFVARWGSEKTWSCHSTWLTIFGEHGFPGSIVWLSLFTCCLFDLRRIRSFSRTAAENERYGQYAEMVQSSFLAYLVVGTFLDAAYFDFAFYLVAVIVIVKRIVLERIQEKTSVPAYAGAYVTGPLRQV